MNKLKNSKQKINELFSSPEPWEPWESKLVLGSIGIAFIGLIILGVLINWLILVIE